MDSGTAIENLDGIPTTEPAFGGPAIWINRGLKERAEMNGYIVAEPSSVLITHLTEIIKQHAHELITRQEVQALVDHVKQQNKAAVEELIPALLSLGEVQKVLQNLLRERVSIRDLGTILETLADWAPRTRDIDQLTEYVRAAVARQICKQHTDGSGILPVLTLSSELEGHLRDSLQITPAGAVLAIVPTLATSLIQSMSTELSRAGEQGYTPVVLCSSQIRLALRRMIERNLPALPVLAYNEIVPNIEIRVVGAVSVREFTEMFRPEMAA
jgi:flagellar biosynthesis protein FlhA